MGQEKLRALKLKRATIIANLEMLSFIDASAYQQLGKLDYEIFQLEKQILSEVKNTFSDN